MYIVIVLKFKGGLIKYHIEKKTFLWGIFGVNFSFWDIIMGGAGSSNSQKLNADNAESIEIVTETRNIGAQYSFIDFQGGSGEIILAITGVLLVFAISGLVYIKRRFIKRKLQHRVEVARLKDMNRCDEEMSVQGSKAKQDFQVAVYNPKLAQKQLEDIRTINSHVSSRVDLLEARVFQGEI